MIILGIETSCDETAAALVKFDRGRFDIISNIVSSQVKIHSKYGGIVPEVAARNHVKNIIPVVNEALSCRAVSYKQLATGDAKSKKNLKAYSLKLKAGRIDAIAVTNGPGLITSLLVGVETAKALAYAWDKPLIAVNHIEGHIYSTINNKQLTINNFPILALIVSGGHTQLVLMSDHGKYKIIGETRDDAAGEAFDKVGKLLGLGYPGGPVISARAEKFLISRPKADQPLADNSPNSPNKIQKLKFKKRIELPRPMINSGGFDFSFSGLKTAVLYEVRNKKQEIRNKKLPKRYIGAMCAEFQQAVIDVLTKKTLRAAKKYKVKNIILAGGVSANKQLRKRFEKEFGKKLLLPGPGLSTDNAVMIAMAAMFHYKNKDFTDIDRLRVDPNLRL